MRISAFLDLIILGIVFWAVWSLRFLGVENVGALSMVATGVVGLAIIKGRKMNFADVGLKRPRRRDGWLALQALTVLGLVYLSAPLWIALFGPLQASSAVADQPQTLNGFLIDIVVFTWLGAALGEEFAFRGIILHRFQTLFGGGGIAAIFAALAQAVWFGAGHAGQGLTGMVVTGLIGLVLALFFLLRAGRSLFPLIIAHGTVNTVVLTAAFLSR